MSSCIKYLVQKTRVDSGLKSVQSAMTRSGNWLELYDGKSRFGAVLPSDVSETLRYVVEFDLEYREEDPERIRRISRMEATLSPTSGGAAGIAAKLWETYNASDAGTATQVIQGQKELVWDWEVYHDPLAENFPHADSSVCTFDNPFNPWRNVHGEVFVIAGNIVNYRVPLDQDLRPLRALNQGDIIFHSGRTYPHPNRPGRFYHRAFGNGRIAGSCVEPDYDHNFWVFGPWTTDGYTFSALCHHEFYPDYCPQATTERWINTIHQMYSFDGGQTFLPPAVRPVS